MSDELRVYSTWMKAKIVNGYDPKLIRQDICGAWIVRYEYGNRDSDYGWEIDHIVPLSLGGMDRLKNRQPLQWRNNVAKGGQLFYSAAVTSRGDFNVLLDLPKKVWPLGYSGDALWTPVRTPHHKSRQ
jgi:hypothetical protein